MSHTPLPWTQRRNRESTWLEGADGVQVVKTSWHGSIRSPYPLEEEALANIALIAKAVNAHDALVEALTWAEAALAPFSKEPAEKSGMAMIRAALQLARQP